MRTRPAAAADRAFVIETAGRLAAFGPPPWRTPGEIVAAEVRALEGFFDAPPPGSSLLIIEDEDAQARLGFAFLERRIDYFTGRPHGHIGILAVAEGAEGRGAGTALMAAAEAWARGQRYGMLTLNVFEDNRRARALYERCGYRVETLRYVKPLA